MEPRYVDDEFGDRDLSIEGQDFHDVELCKRAFSSVGRTRRQFKNDVEVSRWRRVDKAYAKGDLPLEWITNRLELAVKYRWNLATLANAIMNHANMEEWAARNRRSVTDNISEKISDDSIKDPYS